MLDKDKVLEHLSPQDIYGSDLKKNSRGYAMRCPFHQDSEPSFQVFEDNKSFRCFGCGAGGSAFDFLIKRDGGDFLSALKCLADKTGLYLREISHPYERLFEVNKAAQLIYTNQLLNGRPDALKYLTEERGMSMESIEKFKLGSANRISIIPTLKSQGFNDNEILAAGLSYRKDGNNRDLFRDRIIFPIIKGDKVIGFGGRLFGVAEGPKYLNSPTTPIFQKGRVLYGIDSRAIRDKCYALLMEGYLDVITCHQHGYKNAVSILGTAFSEEHAQLIRKHTDTVVPVFDSDSAGKIAAERTVKVLFEHGMKGSVVSLPEGEDPDSFIRMGNSLDEMIGKAVPFGCFLAKRFPATRKMVFSSLLTRSHIEAAEFVAYMGTCDEANTYAELNARSLIESLLNEAPTIVRRQDEEIRRYKDFLALFSKQRFVLWQKISGDPKKQAEEMISQFIGVLKRPFPRRWEGH